MYQFTKYQWARFISLARLAASRTTERSASAVTKPDKDTRQCNVTLCTPALMPLKLDNQARRSVTSLGGLCAVVRIHSPVYLFGEMSKFTQLEVFGLGSWLNISLRSEERTSSWMTCGSTMASFWFRTEKRFLCVWHSPFNAPFVLTHSSGCACIERVSFENPASKPWESKGVLLWRASVNPA